MTARDETSPWTATADGAPRRPWAARRNRRARYLRIAAGVALFLIIDVVAYAAGHALHSHGATRALRCPLQTTGVQSGRAVVTYRDGTQDPRMSQAIRAAVAAWNRAPTDVALEPTTAAASLTFTAGPGSKPLPACRSSAARTVMVTLSTVRWSATQGRSAVRDPEASMAKVIGHALGLPASGRCPVLMASKDCAHRNPAPGPAEVAAIDRLYRHAR